VGQRIIFSEIVTRIERIKGNKSQETTRSRVRGAGLGGREERLKKFGKQEGVCT
jgi:hypothetical protein